MTTALLLMWLKSLWDKFMGFIIAAGIFLLTLVIVFFKGRSSGKRVYREKHEKLQKRAVERTKKIKEKVDTAADRDIEKRLEKWYRD